MNPSTMTFRCIAIVLAVLLACAGAAATPIVPTSDAQLVERLPAGAALRAEQRRLRAMATAQRADSAAEAASVASVAVAVQEARRLLEQARRIGDPRAAGQAQAVLQRWPDAASAPIEVLLMQASLQQYLHDFDGAARRLETLLARAPGHAQAWLELATLRRVQGRYAESDLACAQVARHGASLHGLACAAENSALRGRVDAARQTLRRALALPQAAGQTRAWLLTTLAELELRVGRGAAAQAAFVAAMAAGGDEYTRLSYADMLIHSGRSAEALPLLASAARSDAVLLRLAIASRRVAAPGAAGDADLHAQALQERFDQAGLRPQALRAHAREQAMYELWVHADPAAALVSARANVATQREPVDLWLLAQAARAAGDAAALGEVARLKQEIGLHDYRIDALL